jgi:hypothetical protein
MTIETKRITYKDVMLKLHKECPIVCYDPDRCKDPVCRTITRAMLESSENDGLFLIWAFQVIVSNVTFDELFYSECSSLISCMESAIDGWKTNDPEDFNHAIIVYNKFKLRDEGSNMLSPVLLCK